MENEERRRLIAFGWYGGKYSHLNWLLPLLPRTTHYCEPFGGSAAVLINREPSPVETYNDLHSEVVNFFSTKTPRQEVLWVNYAVEGEVVCQPQEEVELEPEILQMSLL
ncbi:MAG TPA: DNA adenine methylase [Ktedonobacteraceae bacterium]|nr:DNA adenine methylase [Ktedonobacteraceae bacterium]